MSMLNISSAVFGLVTALSVIWLVKKNHMHVQYTLWWFAFIILVLIFGLFPKLLDLLGHALGFVYPPSLLFLMALLAIFIKVLLADIERTRTKASFIRLSQKVAILEDQIRILKEHSDGQGADKKD